jgi:glycerol-3-phosphate acyltransferase PlsY
MNAGRVAWLVGAYLAGTFPSAYLVARLTGAREVVAAARSGVSEGDAHVLIDKHVGKGWGTVAAALDVLKGFAYAFVANTVPHLPPGWLAAVGVLLVVGHCFPPYLRSMAGRGLSAAAGVLLALLPLGMVVAGVVIVLGYAMRATGPASTLGFALTPIVALAQGAAGPIAAMGGSIFGVILLRRLVGVSEAAARSGWPRALVRRLVFDADLPAPATGAAGAEQPHHRPIGP